MNKYKIIFYIFTMIFAFICFLDIYNYNKWEYDNKIENIGNTLKDRLLNINNIVDEGSGLYKLNDRYVYKGQPNNYIEFNNELWRIVSLEPDGCLKIIRNDVLKNVNFLDLEEHYQSLDQYIEKHEFNYSNTDISKLKSVEDIDEKLNKYETYYVGLLDVYDVISASTSVLFDQYLDTYFWVNKKMNYLYLDDSWALFNNKYVYHDFLKNGNNDNIRPVIYLNKDLLLDYGNGSLNNPYTLKKVGDNIVNN